MINSSIINKYIAKDFLKIILNTSLIFFCLTIILNLFEEINYFKDHDVGILVPTFMAFLRVAGLIYNLFPFIILISTVFLFTKLIHSDELTAIRSAGISNFKIILIPSFLALWIGILIIVVLSPVLSAFTEKYYNIKNEYTKNSDYLAAITVNGIWIKEKKENGTNIIRASKMRSPELLDVSIYQYDNNYIPVKRIEAESANIQSKIWKLKNVKVYGKDKNKNIEKINEYAFVSAYDMSNIQSLYSNLETISFWSLKNLIKVYELRGYSTKEVEIKFQTSIAFPFFLLSMVLLAGTSMLGARFRGRYIGYVLFSIITSIIVYFFNDFSKALGDTDKLPIILSVWMPILIIFILSSVALIHVNQK